ncbi:hypothetical protein D3C75_940890 [compost metagenome]
MGQSHPQIRNVAQQSRVNDFLHLQIGGMCKPGQGDHEGFAGFLHGLNDAVRRLRGNGQNLFGENMLTRLRGGG